MDRELIARKSGQAERALRRVRGRLCPTVEAFRKDFDAQDIVYRNFQISVQNCVDIGSHVISQKGWDVPRSMAEVFDRLAERRFIGARLGAALRNMVVLRNIIVHDYARIDLQQAHSLLRASLKAIPLFCSTALRKAASRG